MKDITKNKGIVFLLMAILGMFSTVQAIIDKKILFVVLFVVFAGIKALIIWKFEPERKGGTDLYRCKCESDIDTYIAMIPLLWIAYKYLTTFNKVGEILSTNNVFSALIVIIIVNFIINLVVKKAIISIHLKLIIDILLVQFILNTGDVLNYMVYGYFSIVIITYLIALKRTVVRDKSASDYKYRSLYTASYSWMFSITIVGLYNVEAIVTLINSPYKLIEIRWVLAILLIAIIGVKLVSDKAEWINHSQAGVLFLFLIYYISVQNGYLSYSLLGIIVSCLLADWLVNILNKYNYLNGTFAIPVFYLFYIPVMIIICESFAKSLYNMITVLIVAVVIMAIAKIRKTALNSVLLVPVLTFISFALLITAKANIEKLNYILILGLLGLMICIYVKLSSFNNYNAAKDKNRISYRSKFILCWIFIGLSLVITAKYSISNKCYVKTTIIPEVSALEIGNEIDVKFAGVADDVAIKVNWGGDNTETFMDKNAVRTSIKGNYMLLVAIEPDGSRQEFYQYFFLWGKKSE